MFTEADTWSGGSSELLVALGKCDPAQKLRALRGTWSWSALSGPYAQSRIEPEQQARIEPAPGLPLYGVATLPDGVSQVAFATTLVEDDDGCWLYAGAPLGSLGTVYDVGAFPFEAGFAAWEHEVYAWLYALAEHLFREFAFERAVIGWLTTKEVDELAQKRMPENRFHGYIIAADGKLRYYAPNQNTASMES